MTLDDATRRQLRFSLFLQGAGLLMFLAAFTVRFLNSGMDALTAFFGIAFALIAVAMWTTRRQLLR